MLFFTNNKDKNEDERYVEVDAHNLSSFLKCVDENDSSGALGFMRFRGNDQGKEDAEKVVNTLKKSSWF